MTKKLSLSALNSIDFQFVWQISCLYPHLWTILLEKEVHGYNSSLSRRSFAQKHPGLVMSFPTFFGQSSYKRGVTKDMLFSCLAM